MLLFIETAGLD